jgi:tripartite motif-containing protein 71
LSQIFVSNREQHNISAFSIFGNHLYSFGQVGIDESLFRPTGIACDNHNRRLLVVDKDNHRIAIFSLDGGFISTFGRHGKGDGEFSYPWDVDVSSTGDKIVVSDTKNHRIQLFDRYAKIESKE